MLTAHPDPVKGHPHLFVCICTTCEFSSGWRSGAARQHQGGWQGGLDVLCENGYGASAVKTNSDNNVKEVILVIVA